MCIFLDCLHERFIFADLPYFFATLFPYFYSFIRPFMASTHFFLSFLKTDLRSMLDVFETKTIDRNGHEVSNRNKNIWTKKKQRLDHSDQNKPRRDNSYIFIYFFSFFLFLFLLPCFYFIHLMSFTSNPTIQLLRWIINFFPFGSAYVSIKKKLFLKVLRHLWSWPSYKMCCYFFMT